MIVALWIASALALAEEEPPPGATVIVHEDTSGPDSGRSLSHDELQVLPGRSADELLRAMPGLHMSAHGGRGKAYQYFLRGFDAVHGGDLAVQVAGVPLNELSNPHAHGYLDLNLMPTLLLRRLELSPGNARPDVGDFAVAGSADFSLGLADAGGLARLSLGTDRSAAATLAWRPEQRSAGNFLVVEGDLGQGVGASRGWRQTRAAAGVEGALWGAQARAWVLAYGADFESPGVLLESDVAAGATPFYGAYPGSGGGRSTRVLGGAQLNGGWSEGAWQAQVYGGARGLTLEQNFTGWFEDPVHGDGLRQTLQSSTLGAQARTGWTPSPGLLLQGGLQLRVEQIARQSDGITVQGVVHAPGAREQGTHLQSGLWTSASVQRGLWRVEPGLRADLVAISRSGARAQAPFLSPKLALSRDGDWLQVFAGYGRAFRSTDLGGVDGPGALPLTRVHGADLGVEGALGPALSLRLVGFGSLVSDEVVFDHVQARYLNSGASERVGGEAGLQIQVGPSLRVDLEVSYARGRYQLSKAPVPYAPRLLASATLLSLGMPLGPGQLRGSLRGWLLGPRPLPSDFVSRPTGMVDLKLRYELARWSVGLDVDNLLAQELRDGEFVYASQWALDAPRSELPVRHITAAAAPAARLSLTWSF